MKITSVSGLFLGALLLSLLSASSAGASAYCHETCWNGIPCGVNCLVCGANSGLDFPDGTCEYPESTTCEALGYQCTAPPTCPSTRDYTITTAANQSLYAYNVGCYWHPYTYPEEARRFDRWKYRIRYDNYRETTNCNGSKTTQLLSTSYSAYTYCMRPNLFPPCSTPLPFFVSGYPFCPF